ncbi:MAG: D-alanine--D-alanine ligase [bacterium]|nr:D-alanine--D-alanine ligase [bacterium]
MNSEIVKFQILREKKILVLYGGWSAERDISCLTGKAILSSLLHQRFNVAGFDVREDNLADIDCDIAYIALHGTGGEDGIIQDFLASKGICYTGSNATVSRVCIDKFRTKQKLDALNIPTPSYFKSKVAKLVFKGEPIVCKAMNEGSAIGVHIIKTQEDFERAILDLSKYNEVMVEEYIAGREFTVGIVGDLVLPVIEIVSANEFYDFDAKYSLGKSKHLFPLGFDFLKDLAKKTHDALGCRAVSRVDFMLDKAGKPFVIEINTIPGMTETSLLPDAAAKIGINFDDLVFRILETSVFNKVF